MTKTELPWSVERKTPIAIAIRIQMKRSGDWEQWGLLTADRHIDNPASDLQLQRYHLDQAKQRDAFVLDFGDLFDAMQGKQDKRSRKRDIRPEIFENESSYLNGLVNYARDFFGPYSDNLALISRGNHEQSIDNKLEYDLVDALIYKLKAEFNSPVAQGGYRGWVRFLFENGSARFGRNGYWIHGYGGGGAVTKDVIQTNRKAVYLSNADYVFSGHTHDQWWVPIERTHLLDSGREIWTRQHHVKIPSYKDEFFDKNDGFHIETGKPPKPRGAWWMRFYWSKREEDVQVQFIPADL